MATNKFGEIDVDGLKEFQRAARRSTDTELPKRLGRAHKHIGQLVIDRLYPSSNPAAVGKGAGAAVRASASKRDVLLRVGGKHRVHESIPKPTTSGDRYAYAYWGKRAGPLAFQRRPERPHIRGTIDRYADEIGDEYLEAISAAMSGAFAKTTP